MFSTAEFSFWANLLMLNFWFLRVSWWVILAGKNSREGSATLKLIGVLFFKLESAWTCLNTSENAWTHNKIPEKRLTKSSPWIKNSTSRKSCRIKIQSSRSFTVCSFHTFELWICLNKPERSLKTWKIMKNWACLKNDPSMKNLELWNVHRK